MPWCNGYQLHTQHMSPTEHAIKFNKIRKATITNFNIKCSKN